MQDARENIPPLVVGAKKMRLRRRLEPIDQIAVDALRTHRLEHQRFVQKVGDFKSSYDAGTIGLSNEVMHFLADWLKDHILGTDKKFSPFFNSKGLY